MADATALVCFLYNFAYTILICLNFSTLSTGEIIPGFDAVPENASDAEWEAWIRKTYFPTSHPVATCAMMRRSLGGSFPLNQFTYSFGLPDFFLYIGVVDARLKVYDTANLRIVDASVLPLQICAHLASTLYGVAEKAADLIKSDQTSTEV